MPLYEYQCVDCGVRDDRIAGLDDRAALCIRCGGVMLRGDEDIFGPYFDQDEPMIPSEAVNETGSMDRRMAFLGRVR